MINNEDLLLALRNRLLTVSGLPATAQRAWINKKFSPTDGTPYLEEDFQMTPPQIVTVAASLGTIEARGFYVVRWYGIQDAGVLAINTGVAAILAAFPAGLRLSAGSDTLRISTRPAPYAGGITPLGNGFSVCTITIPFWLHSTNAVAA